MRRFIPLAAVATLSAATAAHAAAVGPSAYLQQSDSPFAGLTFDYFHLEDFEDHALSTPGVTGDAGGGVTSVVFGPSVHDSVDADDGAIDGSGLAGDSWFSGAGSARFDFSAATLGGLPTHAGLVWTDGGGTVTFEAIGPGNVSLGTIGPFSDAGSPDGGVSGETAEDRFFGFTNPGGILAIVVSNTGGGIEVDHVQYGHADGVIEPPPPTPVPLPPAVLMAVAPLLGVLAIAKRRRHG